MKCKCRRCGTDRSIFWWTFAVGAPAGCTVEEDQTFHLCDKCVHEFIQFMEDQFVQFTEAKE